MELHIYPDLTAMSISVADWFTGYVSETLRRQDRFTLALSGGSTPRQLHELLCSPPYKDKIDWSRLHIFFGDERFVPLKDARNNARMAFDTLLNKVAIPPSQIHVMQTENITPEASASAYAKLLHSYFPPATDDVVSQSFDLVFLGMGDDGHTLSLFPGKSEIIHESEKWCTALWLESQDMYRITLTHSIVNRSACVAFLVSGKGKAAALKEVISGDYAPDLYPAQIIAPVNGSLHWFADKDAAEELS